MTTNEKSTEVRLCVLLTPFAPWALSWATLLRWEEKNMVVATASEDTPHTTACWGTLTMATPQQEGDTALQPTKHRSKCGEQEPSAELALFEAMLGIRRENAQQSSTPGIWTGWGSSSSRDAGESTNILLWKAAEQAMGAVKEEGREIPSYRHRAGEDVSCESRRGLDRMSQERV